MLENTETYGRLVLAEISLAHRGAQPADLTDIDTLEHISALQPQSKKA